MSFTKPKQAEDNGPSLRCSAHGCPQRWSVDPGRLCSYHAWEDPKKWHGITESLNRDGPWELQPRRMVDTSSHPGDWKAWAKRLQERDMAGEHLSPMQRKLYKDAQHTNLIAEAA